MTTRLYAVRVAGRALTGLDHAIACPEPPAPSTTRQVPLCGLRGGQRALFRVRTAPDSTPVRFFSGQTIAIWNPCPTCLAVMRRGKHHGPAATSPSTDQQPNPTETAGADR